MQNPHTELEWPYVRFLLTSATTISLQESNKKHNYYSEIWNLLPFVFVNTRLAERGAFYTNCDDRLTKYKLRKSQKQKSKEKKRRKNRTANDLLNKLF